MGIYEKLLEENGRRLGNLGNDYDYALADGIDNNGHSVDAGKLPNHVSFSSESKYSGDELPGGEWGEDFQGTTFKPTARMIKEAGGVEAYRDKFDWNEQGVPGKTRLDMSAITKLLDVKGDLSKNYDKEIVGAMMNAGTPQLDRGPRLAFYADKEGLDRFSKAGFTRSKEEKALDYTSLEDGTDRYYISDEDMEMKDLEGSRLKKRMKHDKFFAAYPDLGDMPVTYRNDENAHGSYDTMQKQLNFSRYNNKSSLANASYDYREKANRSLNMHEVQHAVNDKVGWNNGYGNLAGVMNNPEMYWNSGNEAQSYMVERILNHTGGVKSGIDMITSDGGPINSMRDFMESKTENRLFYEEKMTPEKRRIIKRQKEIDDFWENGPQ